MEKLINEKFNSISTATIKVTIPMTIWNEWNEDCEKNFNSTRYLKMKFDHEFRKQFRFISEMIIEDLEQLRQRVNYLESLLSEKESKRMTFAERREMSKK